MFVRDNASIRITRDANTFVLLVRGPGSAEHSHHFDGEGSLEEFRSWYQQFLEGEGWELKGTLERRVNVDPSHVPQGPERRRGR